MMQDREIQNDPPHIPSLLPHSFITIAIAIALLPNCAMPRLNLLLLSLLLGISVVVSKGFGHSLIPVSHCRQFGLPAKTFEVQSPITTTRGGSALSTTSKTMLFAADPNASKCPVSKSMATFGALWGSWGVVYILVKAVKRVLPIALEPWKGTLTLSPFQWGYVTKLWHVVDHDNNDSSHGMTWHDMDLRPCCFYCHISHPCLALSTL